MVTKDWRTSSINKLFENHTDLIRFVGKHISIASFLPQGKLVCCPFHMDNRPSAKVCLEDEDRVHRLYCFSCRKTFTSWDYITKVLKKDPEQELKNRFTVQELRTMKEEWRETTQTEASLPPDWEDRTLDEKLKYLYLGDTNAP